MRREGRLSWLGLEGVEGGLIVASVGATVSEVGGRRSRDWNVESKCSKIDDVWWVLGESEVDVEGIFGERDREDRQKHGRSCRQFFEEFKGTKNERVAEGAMQN